MTKAAYRRRLLVACLAATALSPAVAQAQDDTDRISDMSRELNDPMNQAKVAATLSALSGALLSIDVSPLTRAMDQVDGGHRSDDPAGATLGDLAGDNARDLPYDIARKTPQAMGRMSGMIGALEDMRPQLQDITRTLKRQLRAQGFAGD